MVAPFSLALVLHLALALPTGRLRSPSARALTVAAYGIAAAVSLGRALFRDPLLDLYCWRNCGDNTFLVHADPGIASTLNDIWLWSALALALALLAVAAHRLVTATRPARRVLLPLLGPAMLVGSSEAAYALALLRTPFEDPERTDFAAIFLARSLGLAALALGLAWSVLRVPRTRARVARLASELGEAPPPGKLREALVAALGDPDIDVVYPRSDSEQLIDANGRRAALPAGGRAVARITRGDRTRALVVHDPALVDEPRARARARLDRPARGRERGAAGRSARPARGAEGLAGAHRRGRRRRPGAGSSATSTTARNSGCWRSPTTCGSRRPVRAPTMTKRSSACSTRPAARPRARWRSCASSPRASTRRSSPRRGSRRRFRRSPTRRHCPSSLETWRRSASRPQSRRRPT